LKAPVIFSAVALGVLAFACAPRSHGTEAQSRTARAQKNEPPRVESALDVSTDDGVRFAFRVTNAGGGKVEMNFPNGQLHDVVVIDSIGKEVWRWSNGRIFTTLVQNKILRSADTLSFDEKWKGATAGQYTAVARLASANFPIEQRTSFIVR
jgi:hypothetical protein